MTNPQSIEHLDFDVDEETGQKCDGGRETMWTGRVIEDRTGCPYQAVYEAFRACCGRVESLCKDCYNWNCARASREIACRFCGEDRPMPPYDSVFPL